MIADEQQLQLLLTPPSLSEVRKPPGDVVLSNIKVAKAVANVIRTTYGPRGMDKLIRDAEGTITVSNDGATILKLLPVRHPIAHILVDTCTTHDKEVGDGTTGVVLLTAALLAKAGELLEHVHLQEVLRGYEEGLEAALEIIQELGKPSTLDSLRHVARTSLNSKMLKPHSAFFVNLLRRVLELVPTLDFSKVKLVKVPGADLQHSEVVDGILFPPTFSYAGADQQAKYLQSPKILILDHEIEHKHQKEYAQAVIDNPVEYTDFVKAEWNLVYERLERIVATGCNVVLNVQGTGDVATQYFTERGIVCISRIDLHTIQLISSATAAPIQRSLLFLPTTATPDSHPSTSIIGTCQTYEVRSIGSQSYHVFTGCASVATMILRGGAPALLSEAERSIEDALHAMKSILGQQQVIPGGGASEMHVHSGINLLASKTKFGKRKMVLEGFASAFVDLPRILAENCGFDAPKIIAELMHSHQHKEVPDSECFGIDVRSGGITDTLAAGVMEGLQAKINDLDSLGGRYSLYDSDN